MIFNLPKVTIVTVVYNGIDSIEETILSVINQDYNNKEYIVIDGGSSDGTIEIIKKYQTRIDYWVSEKDNGIYDAMNKGIELASGEWINFMNGGDCFCNESVLNDIFKINYNSNIKFIYGNHKVLYSNGIIRSFKSGNVKNIWKGSQFCHQSTFIKLDYHKLNNYNIKTKIVADFEFFYKSYINKEIFQKSNIVVSIVRAGGVSDLNRFDCILNWWLIIEKNFITNIYYSFLITLESFKFIIKKYVSY
jgi:glycosyltransferase involved in cell wall biosynthesis